MKFWQAARAKLHGKSKSKRLNLNLHFNSSLNADLWIGLGDWLHCLQPGNRPMFRPIHLLLANFLLTLKFSSCCNLQLELHLMMQKMLKLPPHTHSQHTRCVCWLQAIRLSCLRAINHAEMWELSLTGARVERKAQARKTLQIAECDAKSEGLPGYTFYLKCRACFIIANKP